MTNVDVRALGVIEGLRAVESMMTLGRSGVVRSLWTLRKFGRAMIPENSSHMQVEVSVGKFVSFTLVQ